MQIITRSMQVCFWISKKAFSTVDHAILLEKLLAYGIVGVSYNWFTTYLTGRQRCCHISGHISSLKSVQFCIPQGSCFAPLLFTFYMNEFEQCLEKCAPNMYPDDTSVACCADDVEELCNKCNFYIHIKCN